MRLLNHLCFLMSLTPEFTLARTVLQVAVPLRKVCHQQVLHQRLGVLVEALWELDLPPEDVLVDAHRVVVVEGVDTSVHLVDEHSQSPPVDSLSVALVEDDLRSDVLWGSADREGSALVQDLGETKICQFEVAVVPNEQVLWLEVSEDDVLAVEVLEAGSDSSTIESK